MSADAREPSEEQFTVLFAAGEEAVVAGRTTAATPRADLPPELRQRLDQDLDCARLLRAALRRPAAAPAPGVPWDRLGRFEVRRELGRGGFGIVYLAHDPLLGREVALKIPRAEAAFTPELRERFHTEARAAAGLDHPNLVPVYEAGEVGPVCFLVSMYCPGVTLAQWLKERAEPVPFRDAAGLVAPLADAVQHAHERGVVHRDLKPGNVLLAVCGLAESAKPQTAFVPKITDFGLAKRLDADAAQTRSGAILGTAAYMAPEQAAGKSRDLGPPADVWALGAILYELLTGRPPFRGETDLDTLQQVQASEPVPPTRLRPKVPRDLETICLKCLQKDPSKRYPAACGLADDLRRFLDGKPIRARPVGALGRLGRWSRRNPYLAAVSGLAVAALLAVVAVSLGFALHKAAALKKSEEDRLALQESDQHRRRFTRLSADLALDRGLALCERDEIGPGLLWLTRALEIAPAEAGDLDLVIRTNLAGWSRQFCPLGGLFNHPDRVCGASLSPDGATVLTVSVDGTVRRWHLATGLPAGPPLALPARFQGVEISPDGRTILSYYDEDGTARLWDADTGQLRGKPLRAAGRINRATFRPDSAAVATGSADGTARLWDTATGQGLSPPLRHEGPVLLVAFSRDSRLLLTGSEDKTARLWDATTGAALGEPVRHDSKVYYGAICPDGKTFVTRTPDTIRVWEVATGKRVAVLGLPAKEGFFTALTFSPDGQTLAIGTTRSVELKGVAPTGANFTYLRTLPHPSALTDISFSRDGRTLATWSGPTVRLWDVATGLPVGRPIPLRSEVKQVLVGPDGQALVTVSIDSAARLWHAAAARPRLALAQDAEVRAAVFSPDGSRILVGGTDRTARLWEATTGRALDQVFQHEGTLYATAFSPDGQTVLTGSSDKTARMWDAFTGRPVGEVMQHGDVVRAVAVSPDGQAVLTGSFDKTARLWDASGRPLRTFPHTNAVLALAFSPDGRTILVAGGLTAQRWEVDTGHAIGEPIRHAGLIHSVAFSPDGRLLLTGSTDQTAQLWDAASGAPLGEPLHHPQTVLSVAFRPDGNTVLTGCKDGTARLWDVATHKPLGPPLQHRGPVWAVAFSPDGTTMLTGSQDKVVGLWDVPGPAAGAVERLVVWVQVLTGTELGDDGAVRVLDDAAWQERRLRLQELGGPPLP